MSTAGRFTLVVAVALGIGIGSSVPTVWDQGVAWAQDEASDEERQRQAGKFIEAGDKLIKQGDRYRKRKREERAMDKYGRALEAYQRAFDVFPNPQLYWLIGLAEQKLGRHLDALRHYQQVLREVEDINPALKNAVEVQIEESKAHVATLRFQIEPPGATISVDGEDIGTAPYEDPLFLEPGEHTVAVTAEGHTPYEDTVSLEAGAESERTISLEKIPVVVKKPEPKPEPLPPPPPPVSKTPLIVGLSVAAAMGAGATITGLVAVSKHGTYTDESKPADERDSAADSGKTFALVTDLLWVGAVAAGAYTAYHYYMVYQPEQRKRARQMESERRAHRLWFSPYAGRSAAGVAVGGRF